jgi:hypothetical protein
VPFRIELATSDGSPRGEPARRGRKVSRDLCGGMLASCVVDNDDPAAADVLIGERALRVWDEETGELRFHGKLREPLVRRPGLIELTAGSPFTLLDRRQLQQALRFDQVDQGDIIAYVLDEQNRRGTTRLRMAAYAPSKLRDRGYDAGKSVRELIEQLSQVIDGPYFVEDPVLDLQSGDFAELALRWPDSGGIRAGARFEFGEGTLGNLTDYTVTEALPNTGVSGVGATPEEGFPPFVRLDDTAAQTRFDLLELWFSDVDVSEQSTLQEKAADAIQSTPPFSVTVSLVAAGPAVNVPPVPRLWHDFDVGDIGYITIHDDPTKIDSLPVRITQALVSANENDDSEQTDITVETVTLLRSFGALAQP